RDWSVTGVQTCALPIYDARSVSLGPFRRSTRMKVQFIWPNFDCPIGLNIGIAYLSGALKAAGHDTRILHICEWLDYPFDLDRIRSEERRVGKECRSRRA